MKLPFLLPLLTASALTLPLFSQTAATTLPPGDSQLIILQKSIPLYPALAMSRGVREGQVRIALSVDHEGRLEDSLVVAYSHDVFADSAMRAVKRWAFVPARVRGESVGAVVDLVIDFRVDGVMIVERDPFWNPADFAGIADPYIFKPHGLGNLDRIPVPKKVSSPYYAPAWIAEGRKGNVTVDFYIDQTGRTRMAAASRSDDPLLASAAVAAVQDWQFEPPTRSGQPVLVRAQQIFVFDPAKKP